MGYLLLVAVFLPVLAGSRSLFLRDVTGTHMQFKGSHAQAFRQGYVPLVDELRASGQPGVGNPNGVGLYPSNLLYLVLHPVHALNLHLVLHLLLMPLSMFLLARRLGLSREAAWVAGFAYATSGYAFNLLNLYNNIAVAAWAPLVLNFCLAMLRTNHARERVSCGLALGVSFALVILGGDPTLALLVLLLSGLAVLLEWRALGRKRLVGLVAALLFSFALAAPQIATTLQILQSSARTLITSTTRQILTMSYDPRSALDLLVPMPFGRPNLEFWGSELTDGVLGLQISAFPGLLVLLLAGVGLWGPLRSWAPARRLGAVLLLVGTFVVLGRHNPLVVQAVELDLLAWLRYPVKAWLAVALGLAVLAGLGFDRLFAAPQNGESTSGARAVGGVLVLLLGVFGGACLLLPSRVESFMATLTRVPNVDFAAERLRFALHSLSSLALLVVLLALLPRLLRHLRKGQLALGVVTLQVASQLVLLSSLYPTVARDLFDSRPAVLEAVGDQELIVFGASRGFLGTVPEEHKGKDSLVRRAQQRVLQGAPEIGVLYNLRYALNPSADRLDDLLVMGLRGSCKVIPFESCVRALRAKGVDVLLTDHLVEGDAARQMRLRGRFSVLDGEVYLYQLERAAGEVQWVSQILPAASLPEESNAVTWPGFDPTRMAVTRLVSEPFSAPQGDMRVLARGPETLRVEVTSQAGGLLVWRRSPLPIYDVAIDDEPATFGAANTASLAVLVPPGTHTVSVTVDRSSLLSGVALAVLASLVGLFLYSRSRG